MGGETSRACGFPGSAPAPVTTNYSTTYGENRSSVTSSVRHQDGSSTRQTDLSPQEQDKTYLEFKTQSKLTRSTFQTLSNNRFSPSSYWHSICSRRISSTEISYWQSTQSIAGHQTEWIRTSRGAPVINHYCNSWIIINIALMIKCMQPENALKELRLSLMNGRDNPSSYVQGKKQRTRVAVISCYLPCIYDSSGPCVSCLPTHKASVHRQVHLCMPN